MNYENPKEPLLYKNNMKIHTLSNKEKLKILQQLKCKIEREGKRP